MKNQPVKTRRRSWRLPVISLLAGLVVAGYFVRLGWIHTVVARSIPPTPVLTGWPAALSDRIFESEDLAHGYLHPASGLAALGRLYHANGFSNEALQAYEGLRQVEPRDAHWPHLEATLLAGYGRADDAIPLYRQAVALAPNYIPSEVKLGDILLKASQTGPATEVYEKVLNLDRDNAHALLGLARLAVGRGEWGKAREQLDRAFKQHPDFARGLDLLISVDEHLGAQVEADQLKSKISQVEFSDITDPWLDALMDDCYDPYRISVAADAYKSFRNTPAAIRLLDRAISLAPAAGSYHRQRGLIYFDSHDYRSARRDAEEACSLSPEDPYAWTFLIKVLTALDENEGAWRALADGLRHCPFSADLHLERARRMSGIGSPLEAIAEFQEAHRLWPSEAGPLVELANTYFAVNDPDKALDALHEALQTQPENPSALTALAIYSIGVGDKTAAVSWWARLRRLPQLPTQVIEAVGQSFQRKFNENPP